MADCVWQAEIAWTLNVVNTHQSYKSQENNNFLFKKIFPDSEIAQHYSCSETKVGLIYLSISFVKAKIYINLIK